MKHQLTKLKSIIALFIFGVLPIAILAQQPKLSNFRPYDKSGMHMFETLKSDTVPFNGLAVRWGAGFTQQFQNLKHENPGALNNTGTGANRLYPLKNGFMTSQANLFMDVQLADGIKLNVTSYMSARHHNEFWVKGGFIQFDKVPFKGEFWDNLMKVATIKIGHFEVNYGDQHFRRSDGGQTLYNPFMENYIVDQFTTEIGGEVYFQKNGLFGMVGMTSGMIKGSIDSLPVTPQDPNAARSPSIYFKGGIDKQVNKDFRIRLAASLYTNSSNNGSGLTLFGGDRTGSNYQNVMERGVPGSLPSATALYTSGRLNPGFSKTLTATMLNAFMKYKGMEVFGTYEFASGRTKTETALRNMTQYAIEGVYRFGKEENLFIGYRINGVTARLAGFASDIKVNRSSFAAGWFLTKNVLLKGEIVNQKYIDFPAADFRSLGKFNGYVIEAVVGF